VSCGETTVGNRAPVCGHNQIQAERSPIVRRINTNHPLTRREDRIDLFPVWKKAYAASRRSVIFNFNLARLVSFRRARQRDIQALRDLRKLSRLLIFAHSINGQTTAIKPYRSQIV
jgi:hypothetical protein